MDRKKRFLGIVSATSALSLVASPALAAVGLPYTYTIDYLTGSDNGVRTPEFLSNASGKICVDPDLYNLTDAVSGSQYNDYRYVNELWQAKSLGDKKLGSFSFNVLGDEGKKCYTAVPKNVTIYVRIKKTQYVYGQKLAGDGKVSYT